MLYFEWLRISPTYLKKLTIVNNKQFVVFEISASLQKGELLLN